MDIDEINWGPDLRAPGDYLEGAVRLYGLSRVVTELCKAVERIAAERGVVSVDDLEALDIRPGVRE